MKAQLLRPLLLKRPASPAQLKLKKLANKLRTEKFLEDKKALFALNGTPLKVELSGIIGQINLPQAVFHQLDT